MKLTKLKASCIILAASVFAAAAAWAEHPLLQSGKKTVYQRVVSHPHAKLYAAADGKTEISAPRTFTSFYVYERTPAMLRVGVSSDKSQGWIKSEDTTEWPQAITMVFTDQMGRQPVLFFKDHDSLQKACLSKSAKDFIAQYAKLFETKARIPNGSPVIAAEPMGTEGQVSEKNFYLLPVLNIDTQFKAAGTQLLEVASINPGISPKTKAEYEAEQAAAAAARDKEQNAANQAAATQMKTGLAFVIDTTISMKPYIDQSVQVVKHIYDELQKSPSRDNFEIAIVAFRNNMDKSPGIEYTTKVVSDFKGVRERDELERLLKTVKEATVSTHAYDEDSYAGVKDAVDQLSWNRVNSKAVLLITDAGPLQAGDPASKTNMNGDGLADYLRERNIYLTALHVKTPQGAKDHEYAENAYRQLSRQSNNRSSYIPVVTSSAKKGAEEFAKVADTLARVYRKVVDVTVQGGRVAKPELKPLPKNATPEEIAKQIAETTGYAMHLQFAGNKKGTTAPQVVKAWIADSDIGALETNPQDAPVPAVYPAVLITKSQLSQMRRQLKLIIQTAEEAFLQDNEKFNFYEQLISAAAQMSRDPTQFSTDPNANLAQKGVLLEVLDGLPYRSRVLSLKKEDWTNMSTGEQQEFIKRLKGLVTRYDEYDRDESHWEGFGSDNPNEWVYRVPLSVLP